MLPYRQIHWAT